MDILTARMQQAYDRIAAVFEQHTLDLMSPRLLHLAQVLVHSLGRDARLLDVGCGTGRDMAWFEHQGIQVTGIDLSFAMLACASRRTSSALLQASMLQLPLPPGHFDGAWCCASLLHLPKRVLPAMLRELQRVVHPRGLVMISVQVGDGEQWEEGYVNGVLRFFSRYQVDELCSLLHANGFTILDQATEFAGQRTWLSILCQTGTVHIAGDLDVQTEHDPRG